MYFLAHRWAQNRLAASVAGVVFAFNGLTWHSLMWPNDIAALGWMPWVVLLVERAWRTGIEPDARGGGRSIVLAAIAGAMQMLAGAPEIILLTWGLVAALWLGQFVSGRIPRKEMLLNPAAVVLLVAGLAAAQLLPFMELLAHSQRSGGPDTGAEWAMPLYGPANFLAPLFHHYAAAQGVFVQYDQYWISSYYLGAGVMALAIAGIFGTRKRRMWLLTAVAVLCVWMALGAHGHLYPIAKKLVPVFSLMRYPIKFIVLSVFIIPLLAAYGIKWHQTKIESGASIRAKNILRNIAGALLVVMGIILWFGWKFPMVKDDWNATWQNAMVRIVFLILIPAILIGASLATRFHMQILLRAGLLALLWADVYTHAPNLNPTVRRSVYETSLGRNALNLPPQPQSGEPRFMETQASMEKMHVLSVSNPADDYLIRRADFYDDCNLLDGVPKVDGFYSLYVREPILAISTVYDAEAMGTPAKAIKDFLGVAYISSPDRTKTADWVKRDTAMPLITAGQRPVFADDKDIWKGLTATNFDPREMVYLPAAAQGEIKATPTNVKILSAQIETHSKRVEVDTAAPAIVVIAEAFYRPWHAYVDGQRTKLWRANFGFQAVEIPAGKHVVRVVYEDTMFHIGLVISCISVAALALIWFLNRRTA